MKAKETCNKLIYGAGKYGKQLLYSLREMDIEVDCFVQTEEAECSEIDGIPVIPFRSMMTLEGKKIVLIAMNDKNAISEIEKKIFYSCPSDMVKVYDCRNFIKDNCLKKKCIVCGNGFSEFNPSGIREEIFLQYHIIGGGYRKGTCPCCGTVDRIRWLYYVLENYTDISNMTGKILHFAPESAIEKYIRKNAEIDYYSCDIAPGEAMHVVDMTDIPYKDGMFDYVISNHVLEHIQDEEKAVLEIKRVLNRNGKWIFSFPICTDRKTIEDKTISSAEQRIQIYGQKDHVRLYGYDYMERFERYGLNIRKYSPKDILGAALIDKLGLIEDDVVMIAAVK
ncbi:methyltransferase domain-containing protein [uncultured Acetatifactor sp.]|uniref:methyltransferase domain-containing protein n=1 Tax=uncultured Acetatifactor sp. TaxID=1671927 RepID=UPI00262F7999|nr:methyltransferase domain-containing protein [uncultured Acetatifactor sp.]